MISRVRMVGETTSLPKRDVPDMDGFGVLAHIGIDGCGYCTHPSTLGVRDVDDTGVVIEQCTVCERYLMFRVIGHTAQLLREVSEGELHGLE